MTGVAAARLPDAPSSAGGNGSVGARQKRNRTDIQALRAIAVTSVVIFHLWPTRLPGGLVGVDIFFVISGFLITSHLISAAPRRPRDFAAFWGRRIQRLLPAVAVVILATLAATVLLLSRSQWQSNAGDAVASVFYAENWRLISSATSYIGATAAPSPFQHFWSLSVEEQYYIAWPFLVAALAWLAGRGKLLPRRVYAAGFAAVVAASLAASVVITRDNPAAAYFSTFTRMWELALGGLLASVYPILTTRLERYRTFRVCILWTAIVGMAVSMVIVNAHTPFPGSIALLPTLSAAAFIAANNPAHILNPRTILESRPVQYLGNTSYAMYLWHWPLIVIAPYFLSHPLTTTDRLAILVVVVPIAGLSTSLVENPVRRSRILHSRTWRVYAVGALASLAVVCTAGAMSLSISRSQLHTREALSARFSSSDLCLGAGSSDPNHHCPANPGLVTTPEFAKADLADAIYHCLNWPPFPAVPVECTRGVTAHPALRVGLLGNSHMAQWLPALEIVAAHQNWRLDTYVEAFCLPIDAPQGSPRQGFNGIPAGKLSTVCRSFADTLASLIEQRHYDVVLMSVMHLSVPTYQDVYARLIQRLTASGTRVVVIRDTPAPLRYNDITPDCVGRNLTHTAACDGSPAAWIRQDPLAGAAVSLHSRSVRLIGLNEYLCSATTCPAVIGGVIVYADIDHLTATITKTLAPYLEQKLLAALKP